MASGNSFNGETHYKGGKIDRNRSTQQIPPKEVGT